MNLTITQSILYSLTCAAIGVVIYLLGFSWRFARWEMRRARRMFDRIDEQSRKAYLAQSLELSRLQAMVSAHMKEMQKQATESAKRIMETYK